MGRRITQRIHICAICDRTPDDGEYMWEMNGEYWCVECIEKDDVEPETLWGIGIDKAQQGGE